MHWESAQSAGSLETLETQVNMLSHQGNFRSVGKISIIHITSFNGHPVIGESVLESWLAC